MTTCMSDTRLCHDVAFLVEVFWLKFHMKILWMSIYNIKKHTLSEGRHKVKDKNRNGDMKIEIGEQEHTFFLLFSSPILASSLQPISIQKVQILSDFYGQLWYLH